MFDSFIESLVHAVVISFACYIMDIAWWKTKFNRRKNIIMFLMLLLLFNKDKLYNLFFDTSSMPKLVGMFIIYWVADYFIHITDIVFSKEEQTRCWLGALPFVMVIVFYFLGLE